MRVLHGNPEGTLLTLLIHTIVITEIGLTQYLTDVDLIIEKRKFHMYIVLKVKDESHRNKY